MSDARTPRMLCVGSSLGGLRLPPFELCPGDAVCLHLPILAEGEWDDILAALTGKRVASGLTLSGRAVYAHRAQPGRDGLFGLFRQLTATTWLRRHAGLSAPDARRFVADVCGYDFDWSVGRLAANPRLLLGLAAAYARGAGVLLFSTAGCDPRGIRAAFDFVVARLATCPAVYLAQPFVGGLGAEPPPRFHLPGARCIEVTRAAAREALSSPHLS